MRPLGDLAAHLPRFFVRAVLRWQLVSALRFTVGTSQLVDVVLFNLQPNNSILLTKCLRNARQSRLELTRC